jgi:predicted RNA-binding protein
MSRVISIIILVFISIAPMYSQSKLPGKFIGGDDAGSLYFSTDYGIVKCDTTFSSIATYSSETFQLPTSVDISNSLQPVLFYQLVNKILWLDNNLVTIASVEIDDLLISEPVAICSSFDKGVWFMQGDLRTIKKIDISGSTIIDVLMPDDWYNADTEPDIKMNEKDGMLYISGGQEGVIMFDLFGNYLGVIRGEKIYFVDVCGNNILYANDKNLFIYNKEKGSKVLVSEKENIEGFFVMGDKIFSLHNNRKIVFAEECIR